MDIQKRVFSMLADIKDGQQKMAQYLNISSRTISAWKIRGTDPPAKCIPAIAEFLGCSIEYVLTGAENGNLQDTCFSTGFSQLNEKEKTLVLERIQAFLDLKKVHGSLSSEAIITKAPIHISSRKSEAETRETDVRLYDLPASAGLGNYLYEDSGYEMITVGADIFPPEASFGIRISGNSMEPDIPDKSVVWVKEQLKLENGQVGIFVLNDDTAYCKKLKIDENKREVHLVSFNPEYKPMKISEDDFLRTVGRVVGKPFLL